MGTLADIANVQIALNTTTAARSNFSTPIILAALASFGAKTKTYNTYDSTNPDNLPPNVLTALSDAFAQTPRPKSVKVGRLSIAKAVIQPTVVTNTTVYSLKIAGTLVSFTSSGSATANTIATGLAGAINTAALGVSATAVTGKVELTYSGDPVDIKEFTRLEWGTITPSATAGIVGTDMGGILLEDPDWYLAVFIERDKTRQLAFAEWVESQEKMGVLAGNASDILTAGIDTDLIGALKAAGYYRTVGTYHSKATTEYVDAAWASRMATIKPGKGTWALKKLQSISPDKLSATDSNAVFSKNGNTFEYYQSNLALTRQGKTAGGEWADVIRFRDYLKDLIQTNLVTLMINRDKIPYTDEGIQLIVNNVTASLRQGQQDGGIAPDEVDADGNQVPGFRVEYPLASEVDDVTKASRVLYITFNARLAGAIHLVEVTGGLAYSL